MFPKIEILTQELKDYLIERIRSRHTIPLMIKYLNSLKVGRSTHEILDDFKKYALKYHYAPSTIKGYAGILRTILNHTRVVFNDVFVVISECKGDIPTYLEIQTGLQLLESQSRRKALAFEVLACTGLRVCHLLGINNGFIERLAENPSLSVIGNRGHAIDCEIPLTDGFNPLLPQKIVKYYEDFGRSPFAHDNEARKSEFRYMLSMHGIKKFTNFHKYGVNINARELRMFFTHWIFWKTDNMITANRSIRNRSLKTTKRNVPQIASMMSKYNNKTNHIFKGLNNIQMKELELKHKKIIARSSQMW